ncbi:MAG: polyprenyl synthetase family protein [Chloroflexi bacterium]|nr:polyprenyl synthetase family protein [Chloroflexota bacterium]
MTTAAIARAPLLSSEITQGLKWEILDIVRRADLGANLEARIIEALGGKLRVLPEGKPGLCAAMTYLSYSSVAGKDSDEAEPAVAAMEMLLAAYDLVDDIEDDEVPIPCDRRSLGLELEALSGLLMLCHAAIDRLMEKGVPAARALRASRILNSLGVDAIRGQRMDMEMESEQRVSVERAVTASQLKSASLVRCAAELGAAVGTDDGDKIRLYGKFGWHFGLMTQLTNDVYAVWPKGPCKSDLRLHKKTLPVAFALSIPPGSSPHAEVVQRFYSEAETGVSAEDVKLALWRCGAIHYAWMIAAAEKARAERAGIELSGGNSENCHLLRLLV